MSVHFFASVQADVWGTGSLPSALRTHHPRISMTDLTGPFESPTATASPLTSANALSGPPLGTFGVASLTIDEPFQASTNDKSEPYPLITHSL